LWFYTAYVHRLGTYLIELNSGRLRIGAARYRELMQNTLPDDAPPHEAPPLLWTQCNPSRPLVR
jgi:hypothetical protein